MPLFWTSKPLTINRIPFRGIGWSWRCADNAYPINFSHINLSLAGSSVAEFAALNVHKRLVTEEAYKNGDYELALKNAFLGTDEDILAGQYMVYHLFLLSFPTGSIHRPCAYKTSFRLHCRCNVTLSGNKIYVIRFCPLISISRDEDDM
jgi:hypothetical protein